MQREGNAGPRPAARRDHLRWSTLLEVDNPAGAARLISVVGKQTTFSNRNTATATSPPAECCTARAIPPFQLCFFSLPPQYGSLASLCPPTWIGSGFLTLPNGTAGMAVGRSVLKPLSLHGLAIGARQTILTKPNSSGYGGVQKGGSGSNQSPRKGGVCVPRALYTRRRERRT